MPMEQSETVDLVGHRSRLLERFAVSGIEALHNYEVIELILTYALPRRDVKPLAKELVRRYKTISTILNTPASELCNIRGISSRTAQMFSLYRAVMGHCLKEKYEHQPIVSHRRDVEEYLRFHFGHKKEEYVAALYLDASNHIIATEITGEGTVNQCAIYPRNIIKSALKNGAVSIILAHNHPGGGIQPSEADWAITKHMIDIGKLLDMPFIDHILISKDQVVSLREQSRWPV